MIKRHIVRFLKINKNTFETIRKRKKRVETRAATVKYRDIRAGDVLAFVCGKERFERSIKSMRHFKTVAAMLRVYALKHIDSFAASVADLEASYNSYPAYREKIKKFGLMVFEV